MAVLVVATWIFPQVPKSTQEARAVTYPWLLAMVLLVAELCPL
jgi:hypothetical protein